MMSFKYAVELGHSSLTMNSLQCAVKTVPCTLHNAQPMQDQILFRRQSKLFRILPFSICNPVICGGRCILGQGWKGKFSCTFIWIFCIRIYL